MTKSSPSIWHLLHSVKLSVKISLIFVAFLENRNFTFRYFLYFWKLVVYLNEVYFENPETNDCVIWNDLKLCVTFCHFLYFWKLAVYLYEVYFENSKTNDCVTVIISKMRRQKTFWPKARTRKQTFRTVETSSRLKSVPSCLN